MILCIVFVFGFFLGKNFLFWLCIFLMIFFVKFLFYYFMNLFERILKFWCFVMGIVCEKVK